MLALPARSFGQRAREASIRSPSPRGASGRSYQPKQKLAQRETGVNRYADDGGSQGTDGGGEGFRHNGAVIYAASWPGVVPAIYVLLSDRDAVAAWRNYIIVIASQRVARMRAR
jgi:hypothetical protein